MKKSYTYALIAVFAWSTLAAVSKKVLFEISNLQAISVSSFFAFLFLLLVNIKSGKIKKMKDYSIKEYGIMCGLGFIGLFFYYVLYYFGLAQLSSQKACVLNYLWPIMLVIFSCILLKERMTVMKGIAIVCSFIGIVILSLGNTADSTGNVAAGIVSCVLAATCYGLFSVLNKKVNFDQGISMMVMWLTAAVCATVVGINTETWIPIRGMQWSGLVWLGVVCNAVAYLLWALALKETENTAKLANLAYLTPFLSLIVSAVLLKERVQLQSLVALIFIVGGILLQSFYEHKVKITRVI